MYGYFRARSVYVIIFRYICIMEKQRFIIRAYGRTELAQMYFPAVSAESAWRRLKRWIGLCRPLACELRRIGYDPARRTFTPREVAAIAAMLGEP